MELKTQIITTGIKGFVGSYLKEFFKHNYNIQGVSRSARKESQVITYNDLTLEVLNKSIGFIHLAGKAHDLKNISDPEGYYKANTELTKQVFNLFLKSDCETFIYMSSVKAVADEVDGELEEDVTPNPITPYGKSKLAAEKYILSIDLPKNKRVYILRPCMIHGPGNKGNLNLLYSLVSKGIPYPFGRFHNQRSFLSVENLCFVINELLVNKEIPSGVYNVADDGYLSSNQLVKIIKGVIQRKSRIWDVPKSWVRFLAFLGDVFPLPINSEKLKKLTEDYKVSNQKIKNAIQKDLPVTVDQGIKKTIASFQ